MVSCYVVNRNSLRCWLPLTPEWTTILYIVDEPRTCLWEFYICKSWWCGDWACSQCSSHSTISRFWSHFLWPRYGQNHKLIFMCYTHIVWDLLMCPSLANFFYSSLHTTGQMAQSPIWSHTIEPTSDSVRSTTLFIPCCQENNEIPYTSRMSDSLATTLLTRLEIFHSVLFLQVGMTKLIFCRYAYMYVKTVINIEQNDACKSK